ncbi:MFS transporter [Metapseudomonas otitidis]|uniref:MFS transporter n=1 Tax=Metapseudomonas otitidis TaxID=319939 RepID=UPI0013F6060D|nr:MFS transporter [Pseudomonas otitidis]
MNEHDYLLAWGAYAVAALGCLLVCFRATGWMWRWLREPLRLVVAVLLLTPTPVDPGRDLYAPAVAVTALDMVFKVGNNAWKAVSDLAMYGMIGLVLYLIFVAIRWPIERAIKARRATRERPVEEPVDDEEPTLRQLMEREGDARFDTRTDARGDRRLRIEPRL